MTQPLLSVQNLSISFFKDGLWTPAVKNINYTLEAGKTLGIVGESGSGKSVSSMALLGLLPKHISKITSGQAILSSGAEQLDLLSVEQETRSIRGKRIGMIFQEPMTSLNPLFTCGNQLIETLKTHKTLTTAQAEKETLNWFENVGLPDPKRALKAYPHELSGGQRQRVMIAMAMCCEPEILIADEPTTALDVTVQRTVLDLIKDLQRKHQTAMIFISHDLSVVQHVADNVLVMRKGEVQETGKVEQVFSQPESDYTEGLLKCKPENSSKTHQLLTVENVMNGKLLPTLRADLTPASEPLYELKHITKTFTTKTGGFFSAKKQVRALHDITFSILKGETLGLVGESGCGKSTLSKIISGLMPLDEGKLIFKGKDITSYSSREWLPLRSHIQFIFQDPYSALNPRFQVIQCIKEVLTKHQPHLSSSQQETACFKLLDHVGLPKDSIYKFPHQFSGGQRQRVVIARALAANPELVIADESVSALDVSVQAQVLNLLNDLKSEFNLTYLFISHDLGVVRYMSDRIVVMEHGEIRELGSADQVCSNPKHPYTKKLIGSIIS